MPFFIDAGIWSSVFAVPTAIVDDHLKMCSPLSLKILLYMLRHPGLVSDAALLSEKLCLPRADISDALNYWVGAGVLTQGELPPAKRQASLSWEETQPPLPVAPTAPPTVPESVPFVRTETLPEGQTLSTLSARPKIARQDVAEMAKTDANLPQLLQEAQLVRGAPLTPVESEILCALYCYYGLGAEVILMLLQYCISIDRSSMQYVEKLAATWAEKGIDTLERVEAEITRLTQSSENDKKILRAFQIHGRGLTGKEREYIETWFALGLDDRLLYLACERALENTGKVSFAYADKIIDSWNKKGIRTIQAALDDLKSGTGKTAQPNKATQTANSSLDMDDMHAMMYGQFSNDNN